MILNLLSSVAGLAVVAGLLFGSAGRMDLPFFWAYLGVFAAGLATSSVLVDPTLTRERLRPGPGAKFYATDALIPVAWLGQYVVAGLDVGRFHWSDTVPFAAQVAALAAVALGLAFGIWATVVNRFFSTAVRIQTDRGHTVITTGPYRFVRHPGYAAFSFIFIVGGLALGSWLAAAVGLLQLPPFLLRTADEDRTLLAQLDGYKDYASRVRYRLLPGVW